MSGLKVGEDVMAKWSGSKRYFKGKVLKTTKTSVDVLFEDGSNATVKRDEVEKIEPSSPKPRKTSRSNVKPSSPKKASPARSRSRSKSAGRPTEKERSRSKSKTKSPAITPSSAKKTTVKKSPARPSTSKSPARPSTSKSPSRAVTGKSPTRAAVKSPTRTTAKSPKRSTTKSPTRSPSRAKKQTTPSPKKKRESSLSPEKSPKPRGRPTKASLSSVPSTSISNIGLRDFTIQAKKFDEVEYNKTQVPVQKLRQPANLKEKIDLLEEEHKQQSEKIFVTRLRSAKQSILQEETRAIQSVDELDKLLSLQPPSQTSEKDVSFFRSLGSLLNLFPLPLLIFFLILACARNQGKLFAIPFISKNWRFYITPIPTAVFFGFVLIQGLLLILPIGPVVEGFVLASKVPKRNLTYRKNGLIALIITISAIPIAIYFNKLPTEFIRAHFLHLATADMLFCYILAISLYIKSFYAPPHEINPFGDSKYFYHNLVVGRQMNPRIGKTLDLKFLIFRICLIGWAVIDLLLLYKVYVSNNTVHCTLAMTVTMQLIYILNTLYREEQMLATATVMYEAVGFYLISGIGMNPFGATLPVLYLVDRKTEMPYYYLIAISLLYVIGFYLLHASHSVKYSIMKNPNSSENQSLETISSSNKRKLVCSGLWGLVRHPNYLGEILVYLAWTLPCGIAAGVPYFPVFSVTMMLLFFTFQSEKRMELKHGSAYAQYKKRVPKRLVPFIF